MAYTGESSLMPMGLTAENEVVVKRSLPSVLPFGAGDLSLGRNLPAGISGAMFTAFGFAGLIGYVVDNGAPTALLASACCIALGIVIWVLGERTPQWLFWVVGVFAVTGDALALLTFDDVPRLSILMAGLVLSALWLCLILPWRLVAALITLRLLLFAAAGAATNLDDWNVHLLEFAVAAATAVAVGRMVARRFEIVLNTDAATGAGNLRSWNAWLSEHDRSSHLTITRVTLNGPIDVADRSDGLMDEDYKLAFSSIKMNYPGATIVRWSDRVFLVGVVDDDPTALHSTAGLVTQELASSSIDATSAVISRRQQETPSDLMARVAITAGEPYPEVSTLSPKQATATGNAGSRLPIAAVLLSVCLIPLLALGWQTGSAVRSAAARSDEAAELEFLVDEAAGYINAQTALRVEANWNTLDVRLQESSTVRNFIEDLVGVDVSGELTRARATSDLALAGIAGDFSSEVLSARASSNPSAALEDLAAELADRYGELSQGIVDLAAKTGAVELSGNTAAFSHAVVVLDNGADLANAYFSVVLDDMQGIDADEALAQPLYVLDHSLTDLLDSTGEGSRARTLGSALKTDVDLVRLQSEIEELHRAGDGAAVALPTTRAGLADLARMLVAANHTVLRYVELVEAAGEDLRSSADSYISLTRSERDSRLRTGVAVLSLTLIGTMIAARLMVTPLRRLALAAKQMRLGASGRTLPISGPREVQEVGRALTEASHGLEAMEKQARALADGRLDDPVLRHRSAGRLGESLHRTVEQLRTSLTEREQLATSLKRQLSNDHLTNVASRGAIVEKIERECEISSVDNALLFVDVDGFRQINSTYGHVAGDAVLKEIASRLERIANMHFGTSIGRLGGDEFLLFATRIVSADHAMAIASEIHASMAAPFTGPQWSANLSVSIAVSVGSPEKSGDDLIHETDLAIRVAKDAGRRRTVLCTQELLASFHDERDLADALRDAIDHDEIAVRLQSISRADTGTVKAVEMLATWLRPGSGFVSPAVFVELAERSDMIVDLDRLMLRHGIALLKRWQAPEEPCDLSVSVNVSGRHLMAPDFAEHLRVSLTAAAIDPDRLIIEITESALIEDLEAAVDQLDEVRLLGVRVALDDFGTGYASVPYLRGLPIDILKIDKSFLERLDDPAERSMLRLMIETGHMLGLSVTIEGVETEQQDDLVRLLGVDYVQGFFRGRPAPLEEWLDRARAAQQLLSAP